MFKFMLDIQVFFRVLLMGFFEEQEEIFQMLIENLVVVMIKEKIVWKEYGFKYFDSDLVQNY